MVLPLNKYARRVLSVFGRAYAGSAQFRGGRKLRKAGWEALFPEIESDVEAKEQFLGGIEALTSRGIVSVRWKRFREGDEVEAIYLEDPGKLFETLGEKRPEEVREEMLRVIMDWQPKRAVGQAVKDAAQAKLTAFHPLPAGNATELADICALLDLSFRETVRYPLRALSVLLYRDSKRLEQILKPADILCREAWGETASGLLGLERKYPEVSFALNGELVFKDGTIWKLNGRPLSLPLTTLEQTAKLRFTVSLEHSPTSERATTPERTAAMRGTSTPTVLSIENKESFFVAVNASGITPAEISSQTAVETSDETATRETSIFSGFLYTGGYPGDGEERLITLVRDAGGTIRHFGDLDPEGLRIFEVVDRCCKGTAAPYLMDRETYLAHTVHGYSLDDKTLRRLKGISHPLLTELKDEMLKTKKGVEQEVILPADRLMRR